MKIHIATNRPVGEKCKDWARSQGFDVTEDRNECDVYISIISSWIIPKEFLENRSVYNFHPAILPEYGGSPIYTMAILNNEKETGVTLHKIDAGIDTGEIVEVCKMPIFDQDTATTLRDRTEELIYLMFGKWLGKMVAGEVPSYKQDRTNAKVYRKKDLEPLKDITRLVRALTLEGKEPAFFVSSQGEKVFISYK